MSNQDMITAILQAVQNDTKLMALLRIMIANNINNVVPNDGSLSPQLLAACQALGIQI